MDERDDTENSRQLTRYYSSSVKWVCYYSHLTDGETEGWGSQSTCPGSQARRDGAWIQGPAGDLEAQGPSLAGGCSAVIPLLGAGGETSFHSVHPSLPWLVCRGPAHIRTEHTRWGMPFVREQAALGCLASPEADRKV